MKLPKITTEYSDLITVGALPAVKAWMQETKPLLKDDVLAALDVIRRDGHPLFRVFAVEATYYTSCDMPIYHIIGSGVSNDGKIVFVEAYVSSADDGNNIYHVYREN